MNYESRSLRRTVALFRDLPVIILFGWFEEPITRVKCTTTTNLLHSGFSRSFDEL